MDNAVAAGAMAATVAGAVARGVSPAASASLPFVPPSAVVVEIWSRVQGDKADEARCEVGEPVAPDGTDGNEQEAEEAAVQGRFDANEFEGEDPAEKCALPRRLDDLVVSGTLDSHH